MGVATVEETPSLTGESIEKWAATAGELHCSLSGPSPSDNAAPQQGGLPCPGEYLRPCPLTTEQVHRDKRNMTQMKEQSKTSERELSDEEIVNL